jgi:hypothetical protein
MDPGLEKENPPMSVIYAYDITASCYADRPSYGYPCFYLTGSPGIIATPAMHVAFPGAVLIDQAPEITAIDVSADWFDCENAALSVAELPAVIHAAWASYDSGDHPGQRVPAVYVDQSAAIAAAGELEKAGAPAETGLVIAHWGIGPSAASALIGTMISGFRVVGVQYASAAKYDLSVIDSGWLAKVSVKTAPKPVVKSVTPTAPPGQWLDPTAWTWRDDVSITGTGLDGDRYSFAYNGATGKWAKA